MDFQKGDIGIGNSWNFGGVFGSFLGTKGWYMPQIGLTYCLTLMVWGDLMYLHFFQKAISQWKKGSGGSKFLDLKESHNTLGLHMNVLNMFGVTIKDIDEGGGELAIRKIFVSFV